MHRTVFDPDHEAFRASVAEFVDRTIRGQADKIRSERLIPREVWREAGRQGFLGLAVPEQFGGGGSTDYRFNAVLIEELAKQAVAYASSLDIHAGIVAPYLVELGTDEQKQRWLPRFCTGELITAIAMTEPSGGTDLAALRTSAVRDGGDWILNGAKTFITNGVGADLVVVAARTGPEPGARGITLFGVESGMPGFDRGRKLDKVGQHEADTAELFFADVRVPDSNRIGEVGAGFTAMMNRLPQERLGCAVMNIANAAQILSETVTYARERSAFGQPIGSFQHNKFVLAELDTKVEVTQAFVDSCLTARSTHALDPLDAARAKWWTAQVQNDVLDTCVQLHGGYGYMDEYRVARAWTDARVTKIWAGSNEIMKELIGRRLGL
ncbi:acyl-CoA dehydrogenase family protein [Sporichthya brevicatena]|uniref:Acyl-CoA dehydrogenase family protein n=1 Tax=Sporichthya brevicatena TaxID=171442 RepID=A0ABP3R4J6_9ACTN